MIGRYNAEEINPILDYTRATEDIEQDDIILRKRKIEDIFNSDPDLLNYLGEIPEKEHIAGESEEQTIAINDFNSRIRQPAIIPWLKINPTVTNVQNMVMFDIYTERLDYDNENFMRQYIIVMVMIHEESMEGIPRDDGKYVPRADVVAYIVKDLLNRTDALGMHLILCKDEPKIVDGGFYCRELQFIVSQPSYIRGQITNGNKYDRWH